MRILVATGQWFPDVMGGVARVATDTSHRLAQRGHEVTVIAPPAEGRPAEEREGSLTLHRTLRRGALPETFADVYRARRYAHGADAFDVAVAHHVTLAAGLTAAEPPFPVALAYHAPAASELRYFRSHLPWRPRRLAWYALEPALQAIERRAVRRAARIFCFSEFTSSLLADEHPAAAEKRRLLPLGIDLHAFTPNGRSESRRRLGVADGARLLLTVRRFEPRMGLEQLLEAMRRLERTDLSLTVVGTGMLEGRLRGAAPPGTRFVGAVPDDVLHDWYRAADLFVLPTVAYEGFGLVTAEALASGTPVVGTPVGATPELLKPLDPRLVADTADPAALAEAISTALQRDGEIRQRCRAYAEERFGWDCAIREWEAALADLQSLE
jgi:glycosyltransferase involved in cell wall biosynthesis